MGCRRLLVRGRTDNFSRGMLIARRIAASMRSGARNCHGGATTLCSQLPVKPQMPSLRPLSSLLDAAAPGAGAARTLTAAAPWMMILVRLVRPGEVAAAVVVLGTARAAVIAMSVASIAADAGFTALVILLLRHLLRIFLILIIARSSSTTNCNRNAARGLASPGGGFGGCGCGGQEQEEPSSSNPKHPRPNRPVRRVPSSVVPVQTQPFLATSRFLATRGWMTIRNNNKGDARIDPDLDIAPSWGPRCRTRVAFLSLRLGS
jgi:hypothetical protein